LPATFAIFVYTVALDVSDPVPVLGVALTVVTPSFVPVTLPAAPTVATEVAALVV
jgi:hypothetical protein